MNSLQEFLLATDVTNITKTINIGGRLAEHPLTIKAVSGEEYNSIRTLALENPNSNKKRRFNINKFNNAIVVAGLVDPNLKDAEMLKAAKVMDSSQLLTKVFLPGEIDTISLAILELSGFAQDDEDEEDVEAVKNS